MEAAVGKVLLAVLQACPMEPTGLGLITLWGPLDGAALGHSSGRGSVFWLGWFLRRAQPEACSIMGHPFVIPQCPALEETARVLDKPGWRFSSSNSQIALEPPRQKIPEVPKGSSFLLGF